MTAGVASQVDQTGQDRTRQHRTAAQLTGVVRWTGQGDRQDRIGQERTGQPPQLTGLTPQLYQTAAVRRAAERWPWYKFVPTLK